MNSSESKPIIEQHEQFKITEMIKRLFIHIIVTLFVYLTFVLICFDFNANNWHVYEKIIMGGMMLIVNVYAFFYYEFIIKK